MNKRQGKVFVDTNILLHADMYQHDTIFDWIDALYEEVYIHQMVLDEILSASARKKFHNILMMVDGSCLIQTMNIAYQMICMLFMNAMFIRLNRPFAS